MAKTQWVILFVTALISFCSFVIIIVSFATNHWINSEAEASNVYRNSEISYGLWSGSLTRSVLVTPVSLDIKMVWLFEENICAFSCQKTADLRELELDQLLNGQPTSSCSTGRMFSPTKLINNSTKLLTKATPKKEDFLNAGLWMSTVIFLLIGCLFAFNAGFFSIINVMYNPVEPLLNIFGLYIWNGITIFSLILVLIIYGVLFETNIKHNIAITDTLQSQSTYSSDGLANLGYSYYIIIISIVLHIIVIGLLVWRSIQIKKDPAPAPPPVEKNDSTILLY